ncbi:hypothetical protein OIU76_000946 [Salix suchowensis]|nr:hypothetical protein OIU76_000946 [Salix suchowensis]
MMRNSYLHSNIKLCRAILQKWPFLQERQAFINHHSPHSPHNPLRRIRRVRIHQRKKIKQEHVPE